MSAEFPVVRLPGVYRPQDDTRLLARALRGAGLPRGGHALDLFTGSGALALAAARAGAARVTAVDISRTAALSAWLTCRLGGVPAEVRRGDFADVLAGRTFDLVLANPPYVPAPPGIRPHAAWDAGPDGRGVLDRLCALLPGLLRPRGVALIVHSALACGESTVTALRTMGLKAAVVDRDSVPFGPVLRGRQDWLRRAGLLEPGRDTEDLVVIRGDRVRP